MVGSPFQGWMGFVVRIPRALPWAGVGARRWRYRSGDALLHIARGLADLEQTRVRLVVNRVGVDARTRRWLRRKDFFDGLTHRRCLRGSSGGQPFR
jgi:hypothetical protein